MKNILIYLPALFLLFGCEDFLNRAAYDQMDSENFYRNAEEINAAVMACYNGIHGTLNNEFFLTEVRSDNTRHEGQGSTTGTSLEIANLDLSRWSLPIRSIMRIGKRLIITLRIAIQCLDIRRW